MKTIIFAMAKLAFLCSAVLFMPVNHMAIAADSFVRPNEVIFYKQPNYIGPSKSWSVDLKDKRSPSDKRSLSVPYVGKEFAGNIKSFRVGKDIFLQTYIHPNFTAINQFEGGSSASLSYDVSSFIIYPKYPPIAGYPSCGQMYTPVGVGATGASINFPVLDDGRTFAIANLHPTVSDKTDQVRLLPSCPKIELILFEDTNFQGANISFFNTKPDKSYVDIMLDDYHWKNKASSIKVIYHSIHPKAKSKKPTPKPGGPSAVLVDIAGQWFNKRGMIYHLDQNGKTFH